MSNLSVDDQGLAHHVEGKKAEVEALRLDGIGKTFSSDVAIGPISLSVNKGEIVAIVGGTGVGKSTVMRMAAGLIQSDTGSVHLNGHQAADPGPERVYLAQNAGLFPWLTVSENIAFGLTCGEAEKRQAVSVWLERIYLKDKGDFYPRMLSGGMRQRVALARALAVDPPIMLLDEPFAALDTRTKHSMQRLLLDLWDKTRPAIVLVTHDVEEAVLLADRVLVLKGIPAQFAEETILPARLGDLDARRLADETLERRRHIESFLPAVAY